MTPSTSLRTSRSIHFVRRNPAAIALLAFFVAATLVAAFFFVQRAAATHGGAWHVTERVSVASDEGQGSNNSASPSVSADGRYVVFYSDAGDLVEDDENGVRDIFLRDRALGTTERVSINSADEEANGSSSAREGGGIISADGRYIVFRSSATNLVDEDGDSEFDDDTNGFSDVFLRDRTLQTTFRVSRGFGGTQTNGPSSNPVISADGDTIAFVSLADNLLSTQDQNEAADIFIYNRALGTTERVSITDDEEEMEEGSGRPVISANGNHIAFISGGNILVRDRAAQTTLPVNIASDGNIVPLGTTNPSISGDGRIVAFNAVAALVPEDTNGIPDIYVRDRENNVTKRVSVSTSGVQADDASTLAAASADGRYVAFHSSATNLDEQFPDENDDADIFLRDLDTNVTERATFSGIGEEGDGSSFDMAVTGEGLVIAFASTATNLVDEDGDGQFDDDTNGFTDVFVTERTEPSPQEIKVAVILAEPSDKDFDPAHDKAYFETHIVSKVKHYFCEVSFGVWDGVNCSGGVIAVTVDVFDNGGQYYQLPKTHTGYGANGQQAPEITDGAGALIKLSENKDLTHELVWDAINRADNNSTPQGEVDNYSMYSMIMVVGAGHAQQSSKEFAQQECLECPLTSMWGVSHVPTASPGETARNWIFVSEYDSVGPWAHEMGHALGFIFGDDYLPHDEGAGERMWTLMSLGAWNGETPGSRPAHLSSLSKLTLGWLQSDQFLGLGTHVIEALETADANQSVAKVGLPNDYYLLEARTKRDAYSFWDRDLENDALVIYKVEHDQETNTNRVIRTSTIGDLVGTAYRDPRKNLTIDVTDFEFLSDRVLVETTLSDGGFLSFVGSWIVPNRNIFHRIEELNLPADAPVKSKKEDNRLTNVLAFQHEDDLSEEDIIQALEEESQRERVEPRPPYDETDFVRDLDAVRREKIGNTLMLAVNAAALPSFLLLIGLLAVWVARKIVRSERGLQRIIRVRWITLIAIGGVYLAILGWLIVTIAEPLSAEFSRIRSSLRDVSIVNAHQNPIPDADGDAVFVDLDLHAYDDQGNHVGMNYETGEYEINIPDAIASGDGALGEEWIFVPEGTNVRFEVSTHDIEQFFAENPDIAEELESLEETYTFGAVTYDAESERYEAEPVENITINPGETRVHEIGGTVEEPTVDEGTLLVPFAEFDVEDVFGDEEDMEIVGEFTLGAATDGINPLAEGATVRIGEFIATIPGEDFEPQGGGEVEFDGTIGGIELEIEFTPRSNNRYDFEVELEDANVGDVSDPVTFHIAVGGDFGTTDVLIPEDD